ncbi:MAG: dienelactone hydrolase family protein [Acetobacteraceae bacterium]|nr:dienelactone hydrolase family protein [Acetobacteraceae bacterium]
MAAFLALLALLQTAGVHVERVAVPGPNGVNLDAALVLPAGPVSRAPAIIALHGCGGPFPMRDGPWAVNLARAGHAVLLPDSFGSRGLGSQCGVPLGQRGVTHDGARRDDSIAAARWLMAQPGTPPGGVALMGWSNGGSTVLATARVAAGLPPGLFRRFVAFYPGCAGPVGDSGWRPSAPVMVLVGQDDDWTPAPPCHALAARFPGQVTMIGYPGAHHDFDAQDRPVKVREGAATAVGGRAHAGTNEPARQDAYARVPAWLENGAPPAR